MKRLNTLADRYGYIIHPVLFAIFPLLSFYGANQAELRSHDFAFTTFIVFNLIVGAGCWLGAWILTRSAKKASLLAAVFIILFFSLGRLHVALQGFSIGILGPTKLLLLGSLLLTALVWHKQKQLSPQTVTRANSILTLVAGVIVASTLVTIVPNLATGKETVKSPEGTAPQQGSVASTTAKRTPDIYYFLLDGYGRADILQQNFDFDNSDFIKSLRDRGFYVADQAHSNYAHTHFSVPSTFNMKYLDDLAKQMGDESTDRTPLRALIDHNEVIDRFKSLGYKYIQIGSQWGWTEKSPSADIEIKPKKGSDASILGIDLDEFAQVYLQTTALKPWLSTNIRDTLVAKTLGAYERTEEVPAIKEPTLTFTHIVSPHPPYLFDRNGIIPGQTKLDLDNQGFSDRGKYIEQMRFVNKRMLELVDHILKHSDQPPIIFIAGDHGPASSLGRKDFEVTDVAKLNAKGVRERMGILSAYYFPDGKYDRLYPSITLVNSFRVVLSQYFGANLPLLPDRSFFSNNKANEYRMLDVTNLVKHSD